MGRRIATAIVTGMLLWPAAAGAVERDPARSFLGRWDLTITGPDERPYPSWLEIRRDADTLVATMVGRWGSAFRVPEAVVDRKELVFKTLSDESPPVTTVYRAKVKSKALVGTVTTGQQAPLTWTAARAPRWRVAKGEAALRQEGRPVALFNGTDATGWSPEKKASSLGWVVKDGALQTEGRSSNIHSDRKFTDFKLDVEFSIAKRSNSGVYLRGRHEIQVLDDAGQPPSVNGNGAIYGFLVPSTNASKPADEWQTLHAILVGNRVTVVLNGTTVIDDEEIPGITGGALDSDEERPGPIMLQGDHGPVKYRKVVVTPLKSSRPGDQSTSAPRARSRSGDQ